MAERGGAGKGRKPVAASAPARMDLQTSVLFVLAAITVLLLCLDRWCGPKTVREVARPRELLEMRMPIVEGYVERNIMEVSFERREVAQACMAVPTDICKPKIGETNAPTTKLKGSQHDEPDRLE